MAVANNDILRGTGTFSLGRGSKMQQVIHYQYTGAGDTDDEVGDEISGHFTSVYTNFEARFDQMVLSESVSVWIRDLVLARWDGIYEEPWVLIIGELVGQQLPNGAAALLKPFTNLPRRQGRKFVSGMSSSQYEDTGWSVAVLAQMALALIDLLAPTATANGTLQPGLYNEEDESFIPFKNTGAVNAFAAYQRRRRPGVGI